MISELTKLIKKNKNTSSLFLASLFLASFLVFILFGTYHITKFETVDEHFWKYERVSQYWKEGIFGGKIKKTRINDKPGVTVALISGTGLLFSSPETHRINDSKITQNGDYTVYDTNKTQRINLSLRLPLILFNSLSLIFFFWIILKITKSKWLSGIFCFFLATSSVLIGISQIINPDALLWTFGSAALFSWVAFVKTEEKKFVLLSGILTGLTLLSKYSGNILFPFFLIISLSYYFINLDKTKSSKKFILGQLIALLAVFVFSSVTIAIFMPAIFVKLKYFLEATVLAPGFKKVSLPLAIIIAMLFSDILFNKSKIINFLSELLHRHKQKIFKITAFIALFFFLLVIANAWMKNPFVPLNNLKENASVEGELAFPMLSQNNFLWLNIEKLVAEFTPFVFSLPPLLVLALLALWTKIIWKGLKKHQMLTFFLTLAPILFFFGLLISGVLSNARYSIFIYPIVFLLGATGILELVNYFAKENLKEKILIATISVFFISNLWSLWEIKPFYLNYTNAFLPQETNIVDSWGYGDYEAAEYLNSLPDSKNLVIWPDRSGVCQFFKGKCISEYRIDLTKTKPDYFVFTRRGVMRHPFYWRNPDLAPKASSEYYSYDLNNNYVWNLNIGRKTDNFVRIIKTGL